jgi:5-methylcytosine-specific restriction enzyme A
LLDNYLSLPHDFIIQKQLLPEKKKLSGQGWNYLSFANVTNVCKELIKINPQQADLRTLFNELGIPNLPRAYEEDSTEDSMPADSPIDLVKLEKTILTASIEKKQRLSTYIERGAIAQEVKRLTNYKCLVCEKLGQPPIAFLKSSGIPYIETHHVIPVSEMQRSSLEITNLLTVCANHHRQFHFGKVNILENTEEYFKFDFDGINIHIDKIKYP